MSVESDARRYLVALYRLSGGVSGVKVSERALAAEVARVDLFNMSEAAFEGYRRGSVFRAKENRA